MIDLTTKFGKRVAHRLAKEQILWLTTTDNHGNPQPRPVWFLWISESILIFSQPQAHKVNHIKNHPTVALNFNSTDTGGDVVVLLGEAEIETSPVSAEEMEVYLEKYKRGLVEINMTEDEFNASYSTTIRVKPSHLRGH
jgi:PPOX class probable F420-dependent enzyme